MVASLCHRLWQQGQAERSECLGRTGHRCRCATGLLTHKQAEGSCQNRTYPGLSLGRYQCSALSMEWE